jgi:hypothetical protein
MLKIYRQLASIEYLPVPLKLAEAFFEIERPQNPDLGFDINGWLCRRRFESWQ